ncbi:MAG: RNA-binding S4 domain-containing protein [Bacteroidales bacterium]|jgi:ribosome-associated heat shock protein Hsp15|nr:RNA-binding S4 domain-containing protein [Bacteroidales bacterium]
MRIDKWLWCVRVYKTRTLATEACNAGKINIDGIDCKPSRKISLNDIINIKITPITKTLKVLDFPKSRVGAKLLPVYIEDITPPEEYEKIEMLKMQKTEWRDPRTGRPTKRERREIEKFKEEN